jgi:hypothetical protein
MSVAAPTAAPTEIQSNAPAIMRSRPRYDVVCSETRAMMNAPRMPKALNAPAMKRKTSPTVGFPRAASSTAPELQMTRV